MIIRTEYPGDIPDLRAIDLAAFDNGPEADLVDQLRQKQAIILSLVALDRRKPVGHILFTEVKIGDAVAAALAPMAVLPCYQHRGIGGLLVREGTEIIQGMGYPALIVLGHPDYYPLFGFRPASRWDIHCEYNGVPDEAFMAMVWDETAFHGKATARFRPEFSAVL
jgi:putative acetyltransferase